MRFLGPIALLVLIGLLLIAYRQHKAMVGALPARYVCASQEEARKEAGQDAFPIAGTGSMVPFIPASKPGLDPASTIVAYAVPDRNKAYSDIRKGDLVVYWADWARGTIIHQAAQKDGNGWIMSGLHNDRSEAWERMTEPKFRAVIKAVYVF